MDTVVKDTPFFIYTGLGHHLPVIHTVSFLEQTHISSEESLVEYCTTLYKEYEYLLVALEMMEKGICFSPYSLNLKAVFRWYGSLATALAREDVEVHLHAPETKTEHFSLCIWANCHREKLHNC